MSFALGKRDKSLKEGISFANLKESTWVTTAIYIAALFSFSTVMHVLAGMITVYS